MRTVVGVFETMTDAERARDALLQGGFDASDVRVQSQTAAQGWDNDEEADSHADRGLMDKVADFFSRMFGTDDEHVGHYAEAVRRGHAVVIVSVDDDTQVVSARSLLASAGAIDIDKRTEAWRQEGYAGFDRSARPFSDTEMDEERRRHAARGDGQTVIPVIQEDLEVGKREVDLGAIRVHSRIEARPVNEQVQLREAHAEIERRTVDRPATEADFRAFESGAIEIHETAERPVVSKTARVVEEVVVGTQTTVRTETVSDEVRNTVVEVEQARHDQEDAYRAHYQSQLAAQGSSYEDYAPAYRYGSTLGRDARYCNCAWEEVEPEAQRGWSQQNPGSSWDRAKSAVRHGWESLTSQDDRRQRTP